MLNSREKRDVLIEAWVASQEGGEYFIEDDPDPNIFHGRRDCPRLGDPVLSLKVKDGILQDEKGFYYRDLLPCQMCIREISKNTELGGKP